MSEPNIFFQMLNNKNIINEEVVKDDITVDDIITEDMYAEKIPYLKVFPRIFTLPKGSPTGKGNLAFLFSNSFDETMDYLKSPKNALPKTFYKNYYLNSRYRGRIYNKVYNKKFFNERQEYYEKIDKLKKVRTYKKLFINPAEKYNMFIDLFEYFEIFSQYTSKVPLKKKVTLYWDYVKSILSSYDSLSNYEYKFILINLDNLKSNKSMIDNVNSLNHLMIMYYTLFRYHELVKDLDYDFYYYTKNKVLKFNPSKSNIDKMFYKDFRILMNRILKSVTVKNDKVIETDKNVKDEEVPKISDMIRDNAVDNVVSDIRKFRNLTETSTNVSVTKDNDIDERIREKVEKVANEIDDSIINEDLAEDEEADSALEEEMIKYVKTKAENEINNDEELIKDIYNETNNNIISTNSKPISSPRDKMLREKQKDIVVKGMTIKDIQKIEANHMSVPTKDVSNKVRTPNKNMAKMTFQNFDKTYNEKVLSHDITNAILSLNDKSIPMYVRDIKVEDTSDELNYKETYTIYLEDANRQRHTVKVDIPKFLDDRFIYIGGNKKVIKKQNFFFPVIKTSEDTVQIVTNYNKMTVRRVDTKSVSSVERMKKLLKESDEFKKYFKFGNSYHGNEKYLTTIEYDELSKLLIRFKSKNGTCIIYFNQDEAKKYLDENNIKVPENNMFIGIENSKPIFVNIDNQTSNGRSIVDIILDNSDSTMADKLASIPIPKRLMYTKVKVMSQDIAVMALLCFWEGFSRVLKKMNINYRLSDGRPKDVKLNENYLRFSDCWFIYDDNNVGSSILINGIRLLPLEKYKLSDMDDVQPYLDYFMKVYGKATIINALNNFYEFTIDPITKEILADINLPTEIVELMIYAVSLLADSQFIPETNQRLSRVRSNEIVPAILYEALAKNYVNYRNSNGAKKYSIPQDIVIKNLLALKTVEDYSTLNPALEMEMMHSISSKGFRGSNLDRAYTPEKRVFDQSMVGIIAPSSSPDGNVGVLKTLSTEPAITSVRGYVDIKQGKEDELTDVNVFSPAELMMPMSASYDDPTRLGHAIKQSKHVVPVKDSSPVLISNGMEEVVRFKLSSDFVVNADEDGTVVEKDEETGIMIVKYKSGKTKAVNLSEFIVKNGGGGFFLSNKLITDLEVGDKFKADDVLAYHKDFFTNDKFNNARMNMGTLAKVAIMSTYNTYEDATMISQRLADAAATEMCFMVQAVIGKNSNITHMVKKGNEIMVGEPLIQFDTSYDDNELNVLLANIGDDDMKKQITEESKNTIKSKYSGVIEQIEIYATVPLEEMSPSLKKVVSDYYKKYNKKKAILEKYDPESKNSVVKCGILCKEPTHQIEPNKYGVIKGKNVDDGVLINFYIKHTEPLETGSKIANFTALKNTIGEVIPEGYEPYSEYHPDEVVDTIIASNSILSRMVPSIFLTSLGNKCIIELKNRLREIYES